MGGRGMGSQSHMPCMLEACLVLGDEGRGAARSGAIVMRTKGAYRALCARCARAVRALCEKLAVLHHREFGKFRRMEGCH